MKEVSIILPAYNAERTIINTIESVLNQDYNNYELIIVNDGSNDKTEEICKEYEKKYNKIKFYNNVKTKRGVSSARNYAISKSNAKYIMFIDSDDTYEENMLSNMVETIKGKDLVICGYKRKVNGQVIKIHNLIENYEIHSIEEMENMIEVLQKNELFNQLWNKLFKSEIIKENNIKFIEEISLGEDYRFVLDYIGCTKKYKFINKVLYIYNSDEKGLALKYYEDNDKVRLENAIYHREFYIKNNFNTYYADKLVILSMFSSFAAIVKNNNSRRAKEIIKEYIKYEEKTNILHEIYNKTSSLKLKMCIILLKFKKVNLDYCLGKLYNFIKMIYKDIIKKVFN